MVWVLILIAVLLAALLWEVGVCLRRDVNTLAVRIANLNLDRQASIIELLKEIEGHLSHVTR